MRKNIKYLIMDVDGTLTDGKIYMGRDGEVCKAFNIKDGCGIHDMLPSSGIVPMIITGRKSSILLRRCEEIGIKEVHQGIVKKIEKLNEMIEDFAAVSYIGDDINDLPCMKAVKEAGGLVGCPRDAAEKVIEISDFVAKHDGGDGAVRDFIEWLVQGNEVGRF